MSATPIPWSCNYTVRTAFAGSVGLFLPVDNGDTFLDKSSSPAGEEDRHSQRSRSALDVCRPGLFNQLGHAVGHRDVVEFFRRLRTLFEGELEELERFLR